WVNHIEQLTFGGLSALPQARQRTQIMRIMLRSGYLRGKKAQVFGQSSMELLIPNSALTRGWLMRYSRAVSHNEPDIHISYLKLSDASWMVQELGHITQEANGEESITNSMLDFFIREQPNATLDTHLLAISDDSSRFNRQYWGPKATRGIAYFTPCTIAD